MTILTQPLFDLKPHNPTNWREKVRSVSFDERQIIRWIMDLYNRGEAFDLDVCYSTGRFWYDLPQPRLKFDLMPQVAGVVAADARRLPIPGASIGSAIFDPPFVVGPSARPGIIRDRFSCYPNINDLFAFYLSSLKEFHRVLRGNGLLIFKCQDTLNARTQHWSHVHIMRDAEEIGFDCEDLFILIRDRVLWSPNMAKQQHARKAHSYFLVFRKSKDKRK